MRKATLLVTGLALFALAPGLVGCSKKAGTTNPLAPGVGADASRSTSADAPVAGGRDSRDGDERDGRDGRDRRRFDPDDFVRRVDNPFFPLTPGTVFKYSGETPDGLETVVIRVRHETKRILGVATTVVRDRVFVDGELTEDTIDWYAQDEDGNVWYFGEDTKEYENGVVVSTEGTWLAGVDGAKPGIIMLAHPRVGDSYEQEFAPDVAEDHAEVVGLNETVTVPYGTFHNCLKTYETTPLDPTSREYKYYARGVGNILTVSVPDGQRSELTSVSGH